MRIDDLAKDMERVGLTPEEARIYLRALRTGPTKVSTLAAYFDMSRSKLYRLLDDLAERGIVSKSLQRPTLYEAKDPGEVISMKLDAVHQRERGLEELLEKSVEPLRRLKEDEAAGPARHWKRIEGNPAIFETLRHLSTNAEDAILATTNRGLFLRPQLPMVGKLWDAVEARAREGLDIRLLVEPDENAARRLPFVSPEAGIRARAFAADGPQNFTIFDGEEVVLWAQSTEKVAARGTEAVALWTNAPGVVAPLCTLFDQLWSAGGPIATNNGSQERSAGLA